ncbi:MAG: hypothetical protein ACFCU6_14380 [Balneolaceae bacterium]
MKKQIIFAFKNLKSNAVIMPVFFLIMCQPVSNHQASEEKLLIPDTVTVDKCDGLIHIGTHVLGGDLKLSGNLILIDSPINDEIQYFDGIIQNKEGMIMGVMLEF